MTFSFQEDSLTTLLRNNFGMQYRFIREIARLSFVNKIILYGSRARKDWGERSDIDLAIDCEGDAEWFKVMELVEKADTLLAIDCLRLDSLDDTDQLKKNILSQGKVLYNRDKGGFMIKIYWIDSFETLGKAIERLREVVDKSSGQTEAEIYRDATIQRFEFTAELFWKVLKKFLDYEQVKVNTPREVLQESYRAKLIDQEEIWLKMISDRNLTSHTYKEALAKEIFQRIEIYLPVLEKTYQDLKQKLAKIIQ